MNLQPFGSTLGPRSTCLRDSLHKFIQNEIYAALRVKILIIKYWDLALMKNTQVAGPKGLVRDIKEKYSVRVGLYQDNTPMKDNLVSPHLPGVTQVAYTAGLGYKISDKVSIDFSFIRQSASRDDVSLAQYKVEDGNYAQDANGDKIQTGDFKYKFNRKVNVYGLALNIKIGGPKKEAESSIE